MSVSALWLTPRRWGLLAGVVGLMHVAALGILLPIDLAPPVKWSIALMVVASFGHALSRYGLGRGGRTIVAVGLDDRAGSRLVVARAPRVVGARLVDSFVHPCLVVLRFELDTGSRRSVVLLPGMLEREAFRRLRVYLRTRAASV